MQISGLVKNSFVDYPGKISCVIFTPYCNYDCFYCHNRELIENPQTNITEEILFKFLNKRKDDIEGLVITGGEPTIQNDLIEFIKKVKSLGFKIKLDTNGSHPDVIKNILNQKIIDYIALDYKAPQSKYQEICGNVDGEKVLETLNIIKQSNINYQVRTTLCPTLTTKDLKTIQKEIGYVKSYVINKYRIPEKYKECDEERIKTKPIEINQLNES